MIEFFKQYRGNVGVVGMRFVVPGFLFFAAIIYIFGYSSLFTTKFSFVAEKVMADWQGEDAKAKPAPLPPLDTVAYDRKLIELANYGTATLSTTTKYFWPVKTVYPNAGAILPFNRIVAYYGNFLSKRMGVLGEYAAEVMLAKLKAEVARWEEADPDTPVVPAIHYIAITAQESAGKDGKYILRMPDKEIDHAIELAEQIHGLVFLDLQVGLSSLEKELPMIDYYLKLPQVHLGIDPEFSMKTGDKPGRVVGEFDAKDINFAAEYLAKLVRDNDLPPKILVVHRFTEDMVTNYKKIIVLPEVQIVMDMDGWGESAKKQNTYLRVIYGEPVQFTGFKIFYKNDLRPPSTKIMTPEDVLKLKPRPSYIQYQ